MARIRYLKPDFFKDEDIKELPFEVRIFFEGLWCYADREGRLEDRPERLKIEIFPYDNLDVEKMLNLLSRNKKNSRRPFIYRYEVNGEHYIQILNFHKHQKPHHTEKDSIIPPYNNIKRKIKGKGSVHEASVKSPNRSLTVNAPLKIQYLDHVYLFEHEYEKIKDWYGEQVRDKYIEDLNGWILQIGKKKADAKYKSHYATILNWIRRDSIQRIEKPKKPKEPKALKKRDLKTQKLIDETVGKLKRKREVV